jgi:hypothetical protein
MGAMVTILGLDLLFLVPTPAENAHFGLLGFAAFDSIGLFAALIGMSILIGGGALTGVIIRLTLSRTGCLARIKNGPKPRTRMLSLRLNRPDAMPWSGLSDAGSLIGSAMYG